MVEKLSEAEYSRTMWWRDTQAWIRRIPQELDSKKGAAPLKKWKVFEAESWAAARDAARDAGLLARIKICAGLKLDQKHLKHAEERWEANKRGFRVYCDVNGTLYVYRKKP